MAAAGRPRTWLTTGWPSCFLTCSVLAGCGGGGSGPAGDVPARVELSQKPGERGAAAAAPAPVVDAVATRPALKRALRDPFVLPAAVAPVALEAQTPVRPAAAPLPVPRPRLTFVGRMTTPDGRTWVMAQWDDGRPVTLEAGRTLDHGYRVERLTTAAVELLHMPTQSKLLMDLPEVPRFETR